MKYFCTENERVGTCYHEFQKGKFTQLNFWREDSLLISDENFCDMEFEELIMSVIKEYDYFGETEVNQVQWNMIFDNAIRKGGQLKDAVLEAKPWIDEAFREYEVFTILGM